MNTQYEMVAEAMHWMISNQHSQPGLEDLADHVGLSAAHLQRTFQEFAGVSPKQFLKHLTRQQALDRLRKGASVLDAALDSGLSGPGRLHDLIVTTEALTPGEARRRGAGVDMDYGFAMTPFGRSLVAWTGRGITFLGFCHDRSPEDALNELRGQWPDARLRQSDASAAELLEGVFAGVHKQPIRVWLRGSPFQLKVWEALLAIPPGAHCTYGQIARFLGQPGAGRAVGTAVGRNPVSLIIPCHRVITSLGGPGGYRWGVDTKLAIIGFEAARAA